MLIEHLLRATVLSTLDIFIHLILIPIVILILSMTELRGGSEILSNLPKVTWLIMLIRELWWMWVVWDMNQLF